ncbi:MAG: hypothetical protein GY821_15535, partial [Gammaproteobacteria bacterium]|nr:hypothetical protein [Gammaproteobacteria bacterium]
PTNPDFEASIVGGGSVDNTVCDPTLATSSGSAYNGIAQVALLSGDINDYTITWHDGVGATGTQAYTPNGAQYEELPGGTYTAEIVNDLGATPNACDTLIQVTIIDDASSNIVTQTPTLVTGPETSCNVPNGTLTITTPGLTNGSGDYTYNYYIGTSVTAVADDSNTSGIFSGLPADDYTIDVIDNETGCTSLSVTDEIEEIPTNPDFEASIVGGGSVDNTVCDPTLATSSGSAYNGIAQVALLSGDIN